MLDINLFSNVKSDWTSILKPPYSCAQIEREGFQTTNQQNKQLPVPAHFQLLSIS